MTKLRPLNPAEQSAADMMREGADIAVVCDQTRLSRAQVAAAVDLAKQWGEVYLRSSSHADKPSAPTAVRVAAPEDAAEPEGESTIGAGIMSAEGWTNITDEVESLNIESGRGCEDEAEPDAEEADAGDDSRPAGGEAADLVADDEIAELLVRALQSSSLRAHDLARTVHRHLGEIRTLLEQEDQAEPLRKDIERLEAELAQKRSALAAVLGPGVPSPRGNAAPEASRRPAAKAIAPALFFAREVREWATAQGMTVRPQGRIANSIVEAYVAAHPAAAAA